MDRRYFLKTIGATVACSAGGVLAQKSDRPIRIVVPLTAGSSNDYVTRVISPYLTTSLGQTVIVDNKAGANGAIGTMDVVRSAPDGNTLLIASVSPLAVNMALVANLPYDSRRDLTPIAGCSLVCNVLLVKSTFPATTFAEFIAYAKKHPGQVTLGVSTTTTQVQMQTIAKMAEIDLLLVPYKGAPAAITDVLGGTLSATLADPGIALAQTKGGQMRALAVSTLKRNPVTPDWPAMSETVPGIDFSIWTMLAGPAGMSRDVVNKYSAAMADALRQKDVVDKFAQSGTTPLIMGPDEVKALLANEITRWIKFVKDSGIKPEPI